MPQTPPPDDRDWTFVITEGCSECGFVPQSVQTTGARVRDSIPVWQQVLAQPGASVRPAPQVWSPLEYACHVRDVFALFDQRLTLMVGQDNPMFDNWDQDQAALEGDYFSQDPAVVADQLAANATQIAAAFDAVGDSRWQRPGRRSNGSVFTVETFAIYFLHDVEHHVWDVTRG